MLLEEALWFYQNLGFIVVLAVFAVSPNFTHIVAEYLNDYTVIINRFSWVISLSRKVIYR